MGSLAGQVAIVTGGGRGVGRAVALALAHEGARVAVLARTPSEVEAVAREIRLSGGDAIPLVVDVAHWSQVEAAARAVCDRWGGMNILINNAGIIEPIAPTYRADPAMWSYNIDVNLKGVFYFTRAVLPSMLEAGEGVIINVGSGAAYTVVTSWSAYSAAKAGVYQFTRVLAAELEGTGIRVNTVRPGVVDTEMQRRIREAREEEFGRQNLLRFQRLHEEGLLLPPEIPARLIVWLCTPEAADVHGQEVDIYEPIWRERAGLN